MRELRTVIVYTLLYILNSFSLKAADSLEVSLMTCSPGREVYALYGHTALRCTNYTAGWDIVFNYGIFNFNTPGFAWKFALGECDYEVAAVPFEYFRMEYEARGSAVIQQVLNLTTAEKETLLMALIENCKPENKTYRYNFLYDNCTTRVRDQIENALSGHVEYPSDTGKRTYRQIIHRYTRLHPWAQLGDDLCLGADADTLISVRDEMFAPLFMSDYADKAVIRDSTGTVRPLVLERKTVVHQRKICLEDDNFLSPSFCVWLLFLLIIGPTGWEIRRNRMLWGLDLVLLTAQGAAGCIIAFLVGFSEHPTVGSNWQLWVLNPLPLCFLPRVIYGALTRKKVWYHYINAPSLTLFILFSPVIPQKFSVIIVPLALTLLVRSLSYIWFYKRNSL